MPRAVMVVDTRRVTRIEKHRRRYWYGKSAASRLLHIFDCGACFWWRQEVVRRRMVVAVAAFAEIDRADRAATVTMLDFGDQMRDRGDKLGG